MHSVFKKLLSFVTSVQVFSVVFAFALMVFLSYYFMSGIERSNLLRNVDNAILNTQAQITADLMEPETTLGVIAENVRSMILRGASIEELENHLKYITNYITTDDKFMSYATGIYGYFDEFGGIMISGIDWTLPEDYTPQERPWFKAAVNSRGGVGITEPYKNIILNVTNLTFSRCIYDNDGRRLGIICLDITLDRISDYAVNTSVSKDSYGILMDKEFNVLAHPNSNYIGRNIILMNDGLAIQKELESGRNISERIAHDYNDKESVLFAQRLDNGWYLAVLAYSDQYYQSVRQIGMILSAIGFILALILIIILLNIIAGKRKAEERTRIMLDAMPLCAVFWDKILILLIAIKKQ